MKPRAAGITLCKGACLVTSAGQVPGRVAGGRLVTRPGGAARQHRGRARFKVVQGFCANTDRYHLVRGVLL